MMLPVTPPSRARILLQRDLIAPHPRTRDPLIPTARLLDLQIPAPSRKPVSLPLGLCRPQSALVALMVRVAASGAAAHAEEPEQGGGPGEDDGEPDGDHGVFAEGEVDVVGVKEAAQGAEQDGEEDCTC